MHGLAIFFFRPSLRIGSFGRNEFFRKALHFSLLARSRKPSFGDEFSPIEKNLQPFIEPTHSHFPSGFSLEFSPSEIRPVMPSLKSVLARRRSGPRPPPSRMISTGSRRSIATASATASTSPRRSAGGGQAAGCHRPPAPWSYLFEVPSLFKAGETAMK